MVDVEFEIVCLSHKLNADSICWLNRDSTQLRVSLIDERHLLLHSTIRELHTTDMREATYKSYRYLWMWLLCLNVGGAAHFDFAEKGFAPNIMRAFSRSIAGGPSPIAFITSVQYENSDPFFDVTDAKNAGLCFIAAAKEKENWILDEYIKGLYHLGGTFYGVEFWKDAFANFYRLFEHFVTRKLLARSKLDNEVREIERALKECGIPAPIIEMFKQETYRIRSSQVMHAQGEQKEIGAEEAGKAKILCDLAMLSAYRRVWRETLGPPNAPT